MFFLVTTVFFALWVLRLLAVNDRLRKTDPFDIAFNEWSKRHRLYDQDATA